MPNLMFLNPDLERRFRKLVDDPHEIGGWLFVAGGTMPGLNRTTLKSLFDVHVSNGATINFITSWVLLPNRTEPAKRTWQWETKLNCNEVSEAMRLTSRSLEMSDTLHFHTHPTGSPDPSQNDIKFWLAYCKDLESSKAAYASSVIVASTGFRIVPYQLRLDKAKNQYELTRYRFYSWRDSRVIKYRKQVFGK